MAKKKGSKKAGFRMPGGLGPKGILMGALGLMVAPRIIPVQSPGAHKLAAGLGLRALKVFVSPSTWEEIEDTIDNNPEAILQLWQKYGHLLGGDAAQKKLDFDF